MKKNANKVLSLLMSIVMIAGILSVPMTFTAASTATVELGSVEGSVNGEVVVPLTLSANSGAVSGKFVITYDTTKLEYVSHAEPSFGPGYDAMARHVVTGPGTVTADFYFGFAGGITDAGTLFEFKFKIIDQLPVPVELLLEPAPFEGLQDYESVDIDTEYISGMVSQAGFKITFDANGGIGGGAQDVDEDEMPIAPTVTREGYDFVEWLPEIVAATEDATYTAQWTINEYTISFDSTGGTPVASITQDYDTPVTHPAAPTKEGYTFTGWEPSLPDTMPAENIECEAMWRIDEHTIRFDSDGGTPVASITQDYATAVTEPAAPTKVGHTFDGWAPAVPTTMPAEDMECVAQWTPIKYTISFDSTGGTPVASITQDYDTAVTEPAAPTKEGYTFDGWEPSLPDTMPAENIECEAMWTINEYTISFDTAGGTPAAIASITQDYATAVTPPSADPTRDDYTFMGWSPAVPATMPAGDLVCVAQWKRNTFEITFDANGGQGGAVLDVEPDAMPIPPTVTREGYTFVGWTPAVVKATEDTTYTAQWKLITFKITFDANGGDFGELEVYEQTVAYGTIPTAPAPTREGYTFKGWAPARVAAIADQTYTAKWEIIEYTIFFDANGGEGSETQTVKYGEMPLAPEVTMDGFTLIEWAPAVVVATEDATYTAIWGDTITINFWTLGGSKVASISGAAGTPITAPEDPTKKGELFMGWLPSIPENFPAKEDTFNDSGVMNIFAVWKESTVFIHFNTLGGTWIPSIAGQPGELVTSIPANPTKEGYIFKGWFPSVPKVFPNPILLQGNHFIVTAIWEKVKTDDDVTPEDKLPADDTPADDVTDAVPDTGSTATGIAAFATLSMAVAAAFVLGKKKED